MIQIRHFVFSAFSENTYILNDETKEAVIIDPGCNSPEEQKRLTDFIAKEELKVVKLLNTHCHLDHVFGNQFVKDTYGVELYIHKLDLANLQNGPSVALFYGVQPFVPSQADVFIDEGDTITFGNSVLEIIFVPGHAPGHIAFVHREQKFTISGDVLFYEGIGRYDFPNSSYNDLMHSIREKMFKLGDDFEVYSGHGPKTTIGHEKKHNPFLQ